MSYLHDPRFIFTGDFQSDVSTVNNDVRHYDNDKFEARFQQPQEHVDGKRIMNGWWNPVGGANFRFLNCVVKEGYLPDGKVLRTLKDDMLMGMPVTDSPDYPNGKMVDMDPQMQMVSELWAVKVRLSTPAGELLFEGEISPVGFRDIGTKQFPNHEGDTDYRRNTQPSGACWTSVLKNLKWGPKAGNSPLLSALKSASADSGLLSIHLNSFGYYYAHVDGRFALGKVLGSVGPYLPDEPFYFAATRRLYGTVQDYFAFSNFLVDETRKQLTLDLGNSYPINGPLGDVNINFPAMKLGIWSGIGNIDIPLANEHEKYYAQPNQYLEIGDVKVEHKDTWLANTGGIVRLPLTDTALKLIRDHQLILLKEEDGKQIVYGRESLQGYYLRADKNVFRLDPGNSLPTTFHVYRWGKPVADAEITVTLMPPLDGQGGGPGNDPNPPTATIPPINVPVGVISHDARVKTNAGGKADFSLTATGDPGHFREYVEGQIYLFEYGLANFPVLDQYGLDWLCVHLRERYEVPAEPTWSDVAAVWLQFGNLYPIMSKHLLDMSKMDDIVKYKDILLFAFTRDIHDPVYMPVTRDLSKNKMDTLIKWLRNPKNGAVIKSEKVMKGFRAPGIAEKLQANKILSRKVQQLTHQKSGPSEATPFKTDFKIQAITSSK
ncbi:MAG TPA: hypothetical protein VM802_24940 [Chitinophaga sp.]|uniref:hypothetical protein n=1 Tax=Chitinophaga sp. TaxID=1869181 RepID=UPI002B73E383|nr:hypothetical protein [Chitinophaga sp.]HVI48138.1 hypothetical protein [Chitinophaga sp.]